ncbi:protein LURP-one-related 7 [Andrographis paniculata]|uniref:protein LURP-one-related 7 n=1 Tax=Andrographis paniculata TaxID=175694 RepID=UPI0021E93AD0|nr:protein LURP-one-related 7 [Andrographis paniculata]
MDENSTTQVEEPFQFQFHPIPNFQIPFDLFVSKKRNGIGTRGFLRFTDSAGNLVYTVDKLSHKSHCRKRLLDSSGNALFSIIRLQKGSWQGFKGNEEGNHLSFVVEKTVDEFTRTEFKILFAAENTQDELKTELQMKGCPFKRACTIYKEDSIVAETSLMNKLGIAKHFVPRSRFRVTIFPGFSDHSFVASLVVIYFDGRKLWI